MLIETQENFSDTRVWYVPSNSQIPRVAFPATCDNFASSDFFATVEIRYGMFGDKDYRTKPLQSGCENPLKMPEVCTLYILIQRESGFDSEESGGAEIESTMHPRHWDIELSSLNLKVNCMFLQHTNTHTQKHTYTHTFFCSFFFARRSCAP